MSWKWTSADNLGDILDEDVKTLENEFKEEIKAMTPSSSKSKRKSDFNITYHPESGKRLANRPPRQPKRQRSLHVTALQSSTMNNLCLLILHCTCIHRNYPS